MFSYLRFDRFSPNALPPVLTLLIFIFLCSLTIRAGIRKKENRLFSLFCIIQIVMLVNLVGSFIFRSPALVLAWSRISHMIYVFILPTFIHYIHYALDLRKGKQWIRLMYGLSLFAAMFTHSRFYFSEILSTPYGLFPKAGPLVIVFAGIAMACFIFYSKIALSTYITAGREGRMILQKKSEYILAGLMPTLFLTMGNCLTLLGLDIYPVGGFGFIPMSVFTYGILRYEILDNRGWFSISYIPNFLTALIWTPLILAVVFCGLFSNTILHPNIMERLMTWALPAVFSFLVCFVLATFCFQNSNRQIETIIFGVICALWGFLSLDVGLLMIISDSGIALQISRIDHFFLVMQLGLYAHFLHYLVGIRKGWVYFFYSASFIIAPITQTEFYLPTVQDYPWGLFAIKGLGFDLFTILGLFELAGGCLILLVAIRKTEDDGTKKRYIFFIVGALSVALLEMSNIPAMSGVNLYPFGSFMFIPVLITAYGVFRHHIVKINSYSRRRISGGLVRMLIYGGYALPPFMILSATTSLPTAYLLDRIFSIGIPPFLSFIGLLFLTGIAQRMGQIHVRALLFGLICQIFAIFTLVMLFNTFFTDMNKALSFNRFYHIFVMFLPALQLHLVWMICNRRISWPVLAGFYLGGLLMVVFIPFKTCLESMHRYPWGVIGSAGPVFGLFVLMTGISSILCFYAFFTTARQAASSRKKREMIFFAFVFGFAVSLIAFNIAAMYGIDIYPVGNFIIIPLGLFGYAIFRQNLKEALNVLSTMIYWAGMLFFFGATAMLLFKLSSLSIPGSLYFAGIITWILVHKLIDKGMTSILSLFLVRQREVLEEVFTELPDVLSRIHSHLEIFSALADPVFNDLKSSRFSLCFKTDNSEWLKGWGQHNTRHSFFVGEDEQENKITPMNLAVQTRILDLCGNKGSLLEREQIEEEIIIYGIELTSDHPLKYVEIICPVFFEEQRVAVMLFYSKIDGTNYSEDEKGFIIRLGLILGSYIENARLLQGLEEQVETRTQELSEAVQEITHMNRVIRTISSTLDLDEVMAAFRNSLSDRFHHEMVFIVMKRPDDDQFHLYRAYGKNLNEKFRHQFTALSEAVSETDAEFSGGQLTTQPLFIDNYLTGNGYGAMLDGLFNIKPFKSLLIFPLMLKKELAGSVLFTSGNESFHISDSEISILHQHTNQLAIAVHNAILYEKSEKAARAKSEFLARMSHEIRTPLTAIMAMGDLLTQTPLNPEQTEYLKIFTHTGDHLMTVINDILDFSQIEANQIRLVLSPFDLCLCVRRVLSVMAGLAQEKGLTLSAEGVESSEWVMGDATKLSQVLINLIGNGIKFTSDGEVRLRVHREHTDTSLVTFSVIDTGIGIPDSQQKTVFDRFSQANPNGSGRLKGTGLGLPISSHFVEIMGGQLSLTSLEGSGTTLSFTITLKSVQTQNEIHIPGNVNVIEPPLFSPTGGEEKSGESPLAILLAEDIETNRLVIKHYLSPFHVRIDCVGDGRSAVEQYKAERYGLVLMDVELPEMGGFEAVAAIRVFEEKNGITPVPIVVLSAHALSGYHNMELPQGIQAFLSKPFKRERLLSTLSQWVVIPQANCPVNSNQETRPIFHAEPDLALVIPILFKEIGREIETLRQAVFKTDIETLKRLAHGLKGASANCGVKPLTDYFMQIHSLVSEGRIEESGKIMDAIEKYLNTVDVVYDGL